MPRLPLAKFVRTFSVSLLLACLLPWAALAQSGAGAEWERLAQESARQYRMGNYANAVEVARKMIEVAEKNVGQEHPDFATSLNNLAEVQRAQGQLGTAESNYKRALAIFGIAQIPDDPNVATCLSHLAEIQFAQKQYAQAEPLYKRALAIREVAFGADHPDVAESLGSLAALYRATNRAREGEELEKRAARIQSIKR